MIKEGKIKPDTIWQIKRFMLSKEFGWLPSQIDREKTEDLEIYSTILGSSKSGISRREKRELR